MAEGALQSNLFWDCTYCPTKIQINTEQNALDFTEITRHLFVHSRNGETVNCPVCPMSYGCLKSFAKHCFYHKAREEFKLN